MMDSISTSKAKNSQTLSNIQFVDSKKEIKYLRKVVKKQGNEIAKDVGKMELIINKMNDEIWRNHKSFQTLEHRVNRIEYGVNQDKAPRFESLATFRDGQENIPTNLADEVSKLSSTHRRENSTIDRADLLIMCNKIREDVKKSLRDTLESQRIVNYPERQDSQPVIKRGSKNELKNSIEKYKCAYGISTERPSPVKRIRYNSVKTSARQVAFNSETSRSESKTVNKARDDPKNIIKYRTERIRNQQEAKRNKKTKLASFSPFSTIKSRDKEIEAHHKRLKSKQNLSKLDMIYNELQSMERMNEL